MNHEKTSMKEIDIDLNYTFSHHVDSISPGQLVKIPFAKFKDKNGTWYINFKYGVQDISVMCKYDEDQIGFAARKFEKEYK
jgi:hypothetical protein